MRKYDQLVSLFICSTSNRSNSTVWKQLSFLSFSRFSRLEYDEKCYFVLLHATSFCVKLRLTRFFLIFIYSTNYRFTSFIECFKIRVRRKLKVKFKFQWIWIMKAMWMFNVIFIPYKVIKILIVQILSKSINSIFKCKTQFFIPTNIKQILLLHYILQRNEFD